MAFPIFQKLGGDDRALRLLGEGLPGVFKRGRPGPDALKKWRQTGMPPRVILALQRICAECSVPFDEADCRWQRRTRDEREEAA